MARYFRPSIFVTIAFLRCFTGRKEAEAATTKTDLELLIEGYDKINDYLVDNDPYGSIESSVDRALSLLNSKTRMIAKYLFRGPMDTALKDFTALKDICNSDHRCTRESYAILLKNDRATELRTHMPTSKLKPRTTRVDKIVHHYALEHAQACRSIYAQKFEEIYSQIDDEEKEKIEKVENYMNELIRSRLLLKDPDLPVFQPDEPYFFSKERMFFLGNIMNIKTVTGFDDIGVAYRTLVGHGPVGLRRAMAAHKDKVPNLVRLHLVEPCEYYMEKLGPDVFELADYDNAVLEVADRLQPFGMQLSKYYLAWTYFRVCKILIANQDDLINGIIEFAKLKFKH